MLSTDDVVDFPVSYDTFKTVLRTEGIPTNSLRRHWWPVYFPLIVNKYLDSYPDVINQAVKKFRWASYKANEEKVPIDVSWGEDSPDNIAYTVMRLLVQHYDIPDPGLLDPLVNIVSKVITNKAMCYSLMTEVVERPVRYLLPTPLSHRCKLHAFRELAKRCMIHTHHILENIGALEEKYLNHIFVDMFSTILPDDYVNSIVSSLFLIFVIFLD